MVLKRAAKAFLARLWVVSLASLASLISLAPIKAVAQATPNPGYLIVVGKTTDRAKIATYAASLPAIYASLDGYYLAIGGVGRGVTWLEGPWTDRSVIFAKFPTRSGADAFWWGDAYRAAIRKRDNAGVFSVVAVEGTGPTPFEGAGTGYLIVMTGMAAKGATEQEASERATQSLIDGVKSSGGQLVNAPVMGAFTPMEGDTLFDRFVVAAWPSLAAREAYLASPQAGEAKSLRAAAGISAVAAVNGVPRSQAPTAVNQNPPPAPPR